MQAMQCFRGCPSRTFVRTRPMIAVVDEKCRYYVLQKFDVMVEVRSCAFGAGAWIFISPIRDLKVLIGSRINLWRDNHYSIWHNFYEWRIGIPICKTLSGIFDRCVCVCLSSK